MKAKDVYRFGLRIAKLYAPNDEQAYKLWLAYNCKQLLLVNKDNRDPELLNRGIESLEIIKSIWTGKEFDDKSVSYRNDVKGWRGWIPGAATKQWLEKSIK